MPLSGAAPSIPEWDEKTPLLLYSAAGMRYPVKIAGKKDSRVRSTPSGVRKENFSGRKTLGLRRGGALGRASINL